MARWMRSLTRNRPKAAATTEPSPPGLEVRVEERGDSVRLELKGELDIDTKLKLKAELGRAEARGPRTVIVDLRGLTFMDSMGLGVLLGALRRARTFTDAEELLDSVKEAVAQMDLALRRHSRAATREP